MSGRVRPMADIAVIVATYRRPHLIARALDSIAAQSVLPSEVIVVDDASSDATDEVVRAWAARAGMAVRFIGLERNVGPGVARSLAMAEARSSTIGFLDSDDEYLPHALARLAEGFSARPGAVVSFADARIVRGGVVTDDLLMARALPRASCTSLGAGGLFRMDDPHSTLLLTSMIPTCAALFCRNAAERVGFMPPFRFGEDWLFWLRLAGEGDFVCRFESVALVHRQDDNLTSDGAAAVASAEVLRGLLALAEGRAGVGLTEAHRSTVQEAIRAQTRHWRYHHSRLGPAGYAAALHGDLGHMTGGAARHLLADPRSVLRAALASWRKEGPRNPRTGREIKLQKGC